MVGVVELDRIFLQRRDVVLRPDRVGRARSGRRLVGKENVLAAEPLQAVAVEVVRMTVREPDVFGVEDVALAVGRDAVAQSPAAEIGGVLVAEPRIGRKDRLSAMSVALPVVETLSMGFPPLRM